MENNETPGQNQNQKTSALDWLEEYEAQENVIITSHLYDESDGKSEKLHTFRGSVPPTQHEIGLMFGSGNYKMIIRYRDENGIDQTKTPRFVISERGYGKPHEFRPIQKQREEKEDLTQNNEPQKQNSLSGADIAAQVSAGITQAISGTVQTIAPYMPHIIQFLRPPLPKSSIEVLAEAEKTALRMTENQMKSTSKMMNDVFADMAANFSDSMKLINYTAATETNNEEMQGNIMLTLLDQAKTLIKVNKRKIINAVQAGGDMNPELLQQLQNNPVFGAVLNNETVQQELLYWIQEYFDEDIADLILESIGELNR